MVTIKKWALESRDNEREMANATSVGESPLPELEIVLGLLRLDSGHRRDLSSSVAIDRSVGREAVGSIFFGVGKNKGQVSTRSVHA